MIVRLYIEGVRVDLYEEQAIEIKNSISDSSDIKKINTDFSKDFTVPASNENNKTFKHYYNANVDNTFDARTKVGGVIELSGVPYKFGKVSLLKVNVKKGKPESYTIKFVGNLVDLKKKFGKDELSSLDLSAYDHTFDGATIKAGLTGSLFSGDMIYTLNPKKQYFYSSDPNENTDIPTLSNIADNGGASVHGVRFSDLSPSLKTSKILDAIKTKYSLVFSNDFFGTTEFTKLFQTITNKKEGISGGSQIVDFDGGDSTNVSFISNTGTFPAQASSASNDNLVWKLKLRVTPSAGYEEVEYTNTIIIDDTDNDSSTTNGTQTFQKVLEVNGQATFEVRYKIQANEEFKYTCILEQIRSSTISGDVPLQVFNTTASENTLNSEFITANNIPKIKVLDWLVGIFEVFKLVIIPQEDGSFYIDTLNRYYAKGLIYDVTKYVNFDSYDVARGELFSEIIFAFDDPETILNQQFTKNTGLPYGNEEVKLQDDQGEPLDGGTYDINVPFETVVYDRLKDINTNTDTNIMYAPFISLDLEPTFPKINMFYNIPKGISSSPIRFITNNEVIETINTTINTAFHSDLVSNANYSFLFGSEFSEFNGEELTRNLYTNHHKTYIDSIFNIKRRNFKFRIDLPLFITTKLQLNDVFKIKDNYYRIDDYTTNLITGKSNFNLINVVDNSLRDLTTGNTTVYFGGEAGGSTVMLNDDGAIFTKVSSGYGVDWFTLTQDGSNLLIETDPNNTGADRTAFVSIIDRLKNRKDQDIYIYQSEGTITFDNDLVTFDNDLITFDSNG